MTSCIGFNLDGFSDCDGFEVWTGWDDEEPCVGSVIICLVFCDDFSTLVGFDDDSVMESMDVDCDENCEFDCGACASLYWTGFNMFNHTCGLNDSFVIVIIL